MIRLFTFLLLAVLSFPGWGALIFNEDFEGPVNRTFFPGSSKYYQVAPDTAVIKSGWCYTKTGAGGFDAWSSSTKYKLTGSKSIRNEYNGTLFVANVCTRQTMHLGYNNVEMFSSTGRVPPKSTNHGDERWVGVAYYYPDNEGTFGSWWGDTEAAPTNIFQFMASSPDANMSPEIFISLYGGGKVRVQNKWSTNAVGEVGQDTEIKYGTFSKNAWNRLVVHFKRNWDNTGVLEVWVNGTKVMNRQNMAVAYRSKDRGYWDVSQYDRHDSATEGSRQIMVQYVDAIKVGDHTSSYAEVNPGSISIPVCPPDCPSDGAITGVNSGATITSEQAQVPFIAETTESISKCQIGALPESPVNWDYTTNTSGIFKAPVTAAAASSSQTLKCWSEPHLSRLPNLYTSWGAAGTTTDAAFSGSRFGYTTGITVNRPDTASYSYTVYGPGAEHYTKAIVGDKMKFDFTYSCDPADPDGAGPLLAGANCENLYFAVIDDEAAGDLRNTAEGTAGGLIPETLWGGHGSWITEGNRAVVNQTLGDNVYRVSIPFTVTNPTAYFKYYAGYKGGAAGKSMTLHEVIPRKNVTTKTLTYPVVVQVATTDTTPPTVDDCTITNVPVNIDDVVSYQANINCTTTELGGEYFIMLKDTNAAPADSDAVIAGTGALRSATGPVDSMSISAEFTGLSYQDLWAYVVHRDAATLKSTVATATFDATNKALQLGTIADPIMRGSVPLPSATYATVTIYSGNKAIDPTATVVTALQNVPVVNGVATGREEHVIPGQPSLNSIPNGTYWVLSSRPSGATYALSYGQRAIVTE